VTLELGDRAQTFERRQFQVWGYTVGHSCLLLRSAKLALDGTEEQLTSSGQPYSQSTRIDVLFKGVQAIYLPTMTFSDELTITRSDAPNAALSKVGMTSTVLESDRMVFTLDSAEGRSLVVALAAFYAEDDGDFFDPSPFLDARRF
jgi:hypothetical protein